MRALLFVLALLSICWVVPTDADAATRQLHYHAFCPQGATPESLARGMEESLKTDPTGRTKLAGCYANPNQFLYAFQQGDPEAQLSRTEDLPRYLREDLERVTPPTDIEYYSSCVRGKSNGTDDIIMSCDPQRIPHGAAVYANKHTGRIVLMGKCANPGLVPVKRAPCAYVYYYVGENGISPIATFGTPTVAEEAECPISVQGPVAHYTVFQKTGYRPLREEAPNPCSWQDIIVALNLPIHRTGCIRVAKGWYAVRVPARFAQTEELRVVICLKTDAEHFTSGMGVLPGEYHRAPDGSPVAIIWTSQKAVPADHAGTILWWRWIQ